MLIYDFNMLISALFSQGVQKNNITYLSGLKGMYVCDKRSTVQAGHKKWLKPEKIRKTMNESDETRLVPNFYFPLWLGLYL